MSQRQRPRNFDFDCDRRQPCPCCCHISRRTLRGSSSAASNFASVASSSTPCSTSRSSSSRRWTSTEARSCPTRTSCHWVASSSRPCLPSHHASSVVWVSQTQNNGIFEITKSVFQFWGTAAAYQYTKNIKLWSTTWASGSPTSSTTSTPCTSFIGRGFTNAIKKTTRNNPVTFRLDQTIAYFDSIWSHCHCHFAAIDTVHQVKIPSGCTPSVTSTVDLSRFYGRAAKFWRRRLSRSRGLPPGSLDSVRVFTKDTCNSRYFHRLFAYDQFGILIFSRPKTITHLRSERSYHDYRLLPVSSCVLPIRLLHLFSRTR